MTNRLRFVIVVLILATACLAQEGLTVHGHGKQKWPAAEAQKIYSSACSVLGADKNVVWLEEREIRLTKWDRYAFAQGVVMVAFQDLMLDRSTAMAKRAVTWVDATVDTEQLAK